MGVIAAWSYNGLVGNQYLGEIVGFYIRQSVKVGPLRFNFSKSGVGVSAGVKGLRIGTGPRGNYIHMGRGGVYYRTTFSKTTKGIPTQPRRPEVPHQSAPTFNAASHTVGPMEEIQSAAVQLLTDTTSAEVLGQIERKRRMPNYWRAVALVAVILFLAAFNQGIQDIALAVLGILLAVVVLVAVYFNKISKAIVFFYDLDEPARSAYEALTLAFEPMFQANKKWRINSKGDVLNRKYHAGAGYVVSRSELATTELGARFIKTNIPVPSLEGKHLQLYFYPDRVLVFDGAQVGAISYADLRLDTAVSRFIEDEGVPHDSRIVDRTWKYVNKSGGPDRRFKDNTEIPVVEYEKIHFTTASGLNEFFHVSRVGASAGIAGAILAMAQHSQPAT